MRTSRAPISLVFVGCLAASAGTNVSNFATSNGRTAAQLAVATLPHSPIDGQGAGFCRSVTKAGAPLASGTEPNVAANGSLDDIYACSPEPIHSSPPYGDAFQDGGGFQCTELANRFLWDLWDKPPIFGSSLTGGNFAQRVASTYHVPLVKNDVSGQVQSNPLLPGDIISFQGDGGFGHVAVVIRSGYFTSSTAATGTYSVSIEEENAFGDTKGGIYFGTDIVNVADWKIEAPLNQTLSAKGIEFATIPAGLAPSPWVPLSSPNPGGGAILKSVSCSGGSHCIAVGYEYSGFGLVSERWNGERWISEEMQTFRNATGGQANAVSCTSPSNCEAVGYYSTWSSGQITLAFAESWNGVRWTVQPVASPGPATAKDAELNSIDCTSPANCIAVGFFTPSRFREVPLAERWNGHQWSLMRMPGPISQFGAEATSISCVFSSECVAVGQGDLQTGNQSYCIGCGTALTDVWNGSSWRATAPVTSPRGPGTDFGITSVSCPRPSYCLAIAWVNDGTAAWPTYSEIWNGSKWLTTFISRYASMDAVYCGSPYACTAVGTVGEGIGSPAAAEFWDGTTWTQEAPWSTVAYNELESVVCFARFACLAVGRTFEDGPVVSAPLVEENRT